MKYGKWWEIKQGQDLTGIYRGQGKPEKDGKFIHPFITIQSDTEWYGEQNQNCWESVRYFAEE